jgi:hypothetical protein
MGQPPAVKMEEVPGSLGRFSAWSECLNGKKIAYFVNT